MNYIVCPCVICDRGIRLRELPHAIYWVTGRMWGWYVQNEEVNLSHKTCWDELSKKQRKTIKKSSLRYGRPQPVSATI